MKNESDYPAGTLANDNAAPVPVPVPADNHPAPGVEHQPPADYMQHDAENGVTVNQTKGTTL